MSAASKPPSKLAILLSLHGMPTKEEMEMVLDALEESDVSPETFSFGPAYSNAKHRHQKAIRLMSKLVAKL